MLGAVPQSGEAAASAEAFRKEHDMVVVDASGAAVPDPIRSFRDAGFPQPLLDMVGTLTASGGGVLPEEILA